MNIVWRAQAEGDLEALADYIALDNPGAALRVYDTILTSVDRLATFPNSGRAGRVARTRELVVPGLPYVVIYTIIQEEVQILTIHHTSRKWPKRLPIDP
jgi:toxin ParE1/3/4